jgi:hypothetical protein
MNATATFVWNEICQGQKTLQHYCDDSFYALLFDIPAVLEPPIAPQDLVDAKYGGARESADLYYLRIPIFNDVATYRAAINWIGDCTYALRTKLEQVAVVCRFPSQQADATLRQVVKALIARIERQNAQLKKQDQDIDRLIAAINERFDAQDECFDELAGHVKRIKAAPARYRSKQNAETHTA